MAFFLEATFIGLFFFGWEKLTKLAHLGVTWMVALGSNLSALWILIANGWMQHPVGTETGAAIRVNTLLGAMYLALEPAGEPLHARSPQRHAVPHAPPCGSHDVEADARAARA